MVLPFHGNMVMSRSLPSVAESTSHLCCSGRTWHCMHMGILCPINSSRQVSTIFFFPFSVFYFHILTVFLISLKSSLSEIHQMMQTCFAKEYLAFVKCREIKEQVSPVDFSFSKLKVGFPRKLCHHQRLPSHI